MIELQGEVGVYLGGSGLWLVEGGVFIGPGLVEELGVWKESEEMVEKHMLFCVRLNQY